MRLHDTHPPDDPDPAAEAERGADEVLADVAQARQDADTLDDAAAAAAWERVAHASLMLAAQAESPNTAGRRWRVRRYSGTGCRRTVFAWSDPDRGSES